MYNIQTSITLSKTTIFSNNIVLYSSLREDFDNNKLNISLNNLCINCTWIAFDSLVSDQLKFLIGKFVNLRREKFIQKRPFFQSRSRFVRAKARWPDSHRALTTAFRWKRSFAFLGRTVTRPWPTTAPVTFLTMLYLPLTWPCARTTFNPDDILVSFGHPPHSLTDQFPARSLSLESIVMNSRV